MVTIQIYMVCLEILQIQIRPHKRSSGILYSPHRYQSCRRGLKGPFTTGEAESRPVTLHKQEAAAVISLLQAAAAHMQIKVRMCRLYLDNVCLSTNSTFNHFAQGSTSPVPPVDSWRILFLFYICLVSSQAANT